MSVVPVVHAITNDEILLRRDFPQLATAVMAALGARGAVHLRARWLDATRLYDLALLLAEGERATGCRAVVNDRVDVAAAAGVGAVQLTSRSVAPAEARQLSPSLRIGASVHSPAEAAAAEAEGVDWCVAGTAFSTDTHPKARPGGIELMRQIVAAVRVPVIAIGGVRPPAVPELQRAGVYGVATIGGVWNATDVAEAARSYLSAHEADGRTG